VRGRDPWKPGLSSGNAGAHNRSYYVPPPSGGMHNHKPSSTSASLLDDDDESGRRRNDDDDDEDRELGDDDDEEDDVLAGKIYSLPGAGPTGARQSSRQVARAAAALAARAALEAARTKARQQQQASAHHHQQQGALGGGGRGAAHKRGLEEVAKSAENAIKGAIAARNADAIAASATTPGGSSANGGGGSGLLSDGDEESRDGFIAAVNMQAAHAALDELLDEDFLGGMGGGTTSGHSGGGRQSTDSDQALHRLTSRMGGKQYNGSSSGSRVQGRQKRVAVGEDGEEVHAHDHLAADDDDDEVNFGHDDDDENMASGGNGRGGVPPMKFSPGQAFSEQEFPRADLPQLFKWSPPPKGNLVSSASRRAHKNTSGASAQVEESPPNMGNHDGHGDGSSSTCSESPEPSSASSLQSADHASLASASGVTSTTSRRISLTGGAPQGEGGPLPEPSTGQYITPHQGRRLRRRAAAQVSVMGIPDLAAMPPPSRSSATSLEGGGNAEDDDGSVAGAAANLLSPLGTSAFEAVAKSSAARALPISASSSRSRRSARSSSGGGVSNKDGISALLSASSKNDEGEPRGQEAELLTPSPALLAVLETGAAYRQQQGHHEQQLRSGASSATSPGSGGSGGGFAAGQHAWVDGSHVASTGGTPSADRRFSPLASPALSDVFYTAGLSPGEFMSPIGLTPFKSPSNGGGGVGGVGGTQDRESRARDLKFSAVGPTLEGPQGGGVAQLVPASATQAANSASSTNGRSSAGLGHSDCSKHDDINTVSSCDSKTQQQQPVPFSSALSSGSSSVWSANSNATAPTSGRIAWSARELDASASVVNPSHNDTPSSSASRGGAVPGALSSSGSSISHGNSSGRDAMQSPPLAFTQHDFLTLLADSSPLPSKDFKKLPVERGGLTRGVAAARHASVAKHLVPPVGNNNNSAHCGGAASDALDAATPSDTPGAVKSDVTPSEARERAASAVNFMDLLFAGASRLVFYSF